MLLRAISRIRWPANEAERVAAPLARLFGWQGDHQVRKKPDAPSHHELDHVRPDHQVGHDGTRDCTHSGAEKWADERYADGREGYADAAQCRESERERHERRH